MVVVLHGLGRSSVAMNAIEAELAGSGYEVYNIGYSTIGYTMKEIVEEVQSKLAKLPLPPGKKVHFVGHSLGGLVIRGLLADPEHGFSVGNTVLIATPNKGSLIADQYRENFWVAWLCPVALELGTSPDSYPNRLPPPYYNVGVIAGTVSYRSTGDLIPGPDDGVVTVESAKVERMSDFLAVNANHSRLRRYNPVLQQITHFIARGAFLLPSRKML